MDVPPPEVTDRTATLGPRPGAAATAAPGPVAEGSDAGVTASASETLPVDDPDRYELVGEHARGGLGRIVRAIDRRLGRTVAVKELQQRSALAEALFVREALITARLEHPGIVPVHEAGRWPSGDPYYVMKFVSGRTLKEVIAGHASVRARLGLLPHVIAVADAVGYAHSRQVVHRDLKPSNVVVGDFGETIVVDWGLARDGAGHVPEPALPGTGVDGGPGASTVSGRVIGTPAYMAPEQARGEPVDARADVYALGAMLHEVLAGAPPYAGASAQAIVDAVLAGPPAPLADRAPEAPADLLAIVAKAMARDPQHRYDDGQALAEDLRRFLAGQLVTAHTYRTSQLVRRWIARHRGMVAMAGVAAAVLVVVGALSVRGVVSERNRARAAQRAAEARQVELLEVQARSSVRRDPTASVAWLKATRGGTPAVDRARAALFAEAVAEGVAKHVLRQPDWLHDVVFSPDGQRVAAASSDGVVRVYEVTSGAVTRWGEIAQPIVAVAWSPDGAQLATGTQRGAVQLWRAGAAARELAPPAPMPIAELRWSADGQRLLATRQAQAPLILDVTTGAATPLPVPVDAGLSAMAISEATWRAFYGTYAGEVVLAGSPPRTLTRLPHRVGGLAVNAAGDRLIAHDGETLWRIDVEHGTREPLGADAEASMWMSWSPDEQHLAVGGKAHHITLWELDTGMSRVLSGHTDVVYTADWSRDGHRLLTASDDTTARLWDLVTGDVQTLRGHDDDVVRARFSPDEQTLATASFDGSIRIWTPPPATTIVLGPEPGPILHARLIDDATLLVSGGATAARWSLPTRTRTPVADLDASDLKDRAPLSTRDGRALVIPRDDFSIDLVRVDAPPARMSLGAMPSGGGLDARGRWLLVGTRAGELWRWDLTTDVRERVWTSGGAPIEGVAVRHDGHVVFRVGDVLRAWSPNDRAVTELARGPAGCVHRLEFEPEGTRLLSWRCDGSLWLRDDTGAERAIDVPHGHLPASTAWSKDGRQLAGAMTNRVVTIWDPATGRRLRTLRGHSDLVMALAFSPDGVRLATASYDRTLRIWDLTDQPDLDVHVLRGHTQSVDFVAWTSDGARLVTTSRDATIRLWQAPPRGVATRDLATELARTTSAVIGADDRPATP